MVNDKFFGILTKFLYLIFFILKKSSLKVNIIRKLIF